MPLRTERSRNRCSLNPPGLWLYCAPRAGMAELVDAADSKSVALKRRVGSIPSPGTNVADPLPRTEFPAGSRELFLSAMISRQNLRPGFSGDFMARYFVLLALLLGATAPAHAGKSDTKLPAHPVFKLAPGEGMVMARLIQNRHVSTTLPT